MSQCFRRIWYTLQVQVRMNGGSTSRPAVSVVVPTHNRAPSLRRTLEALAAQTYAVDRFEGLVVANGCTDDTAAMVRALAMPFALKLVELPTSGASLARNAGASMARGDLLLFLDDDVEPLPGLVDVHARTQGSARDLIAMGPYLPPPLPRPPSLLVERLGALGISFLELLAEWKGPLDWVWFIGGNFSISKALFESVGGFDGTLSRHEDWEFGCRAQKTGARFVFMPKAGAYHYPHENRSLAQYLRNARSEGRSDVAITHRHPEIVDRLAIGRAAQPRTTLGRLGRWLAFDHPQAGDVAVNTLLIASYTLNRLRMHQPWNRLVDCIYDYWYLRGVAEGLGKGADVAAYIEHLRRAATSHSP